MKKNWFKWAIIGVVLSIVVYFTVTGDTDKAFEYFDKVIEMIDKQQENEATFGEGTFGDATSRSFVFPVMTGKA